ncbi:MAG: carboxypeptidase regulatory-like domain-containing protein [Lewinellaceae bacterium]|nr:carboxypeptidase regulatory-like domain-containing protein [Lewinellaceae bacterium]
MKFSIPILFTVLSAIQCFSQTFSSLAIFVSEDETSKPVAGASVIIKEAGWAAKTTGSDGKAFFDKSMPIGEIHYIISKEGYQGVEGTFNITTEEKSNTLKIKLSKFRDDRILITGEVVDDNDKDLEGAIIEVKVADIIKTSKTDPSGNYKIELTLNRTQYDVNTLKLEAKCGNNSGKKVETIDLTRRNVIYKDFKLNCRNEVSPPPSPSGVLGRQVVNNMELVLTGFEQVGSKATFHFTLENKSAAESVREFHVHNNFSEMNDQEGNVYDCKNISLGNGQKKINLIYGNPVKCSVEFNVGAVTITKSAYLKIGSYHSGNFEFTNVRVK